MTDNRGGGGDVLSESIRQAVRRPEVMDAMSQALEAQLRAMLAGSQDYLARMPRVDRAARAERIRAKFTGNNYRELAETEGVSERRIRQIVHPRPKK